MGEGSRHTVCTYDYCDITSVEGDKFHFDKACVDRKLSRKDWGPDPEELDGVEHHRVEHVRDGEVIEFGTVVLFREVMSLEIQVGFTEDDAQTISSEDMGEAFGHWANNQTSDWRVGDTFRVLAEWENPTSAAWMPSAFI